MPQTNTLLLSKSTAACESFTALLEDKKEAIIELLCTYETYETALDEFERSINTLKGAHREFARITHPLDGLHIATIFPLNLPLYSLILFGVMPSFFAKHVFIRPPEAMHKILETLNTVLEIDTHFSNISLHPTPRHLFIDLYAKDCDVIIFTGKYTNALDIHRACPNALLVYNGSGINPFLLLKNGDVEECARKAVEMRCFNSGQDCAGPDLFLVPETDESIFISVLKKELEKLKVGNTTDHSVRVGPIMKETYVNDIAKLLEKDNIVFGGKIDLKNRIVYPTITKKRLSEYKYDTFHEYFAPVFNIVTYKSTSELIPLFTSTPFIKRSMYISVFGSDDHVEKILSKSCRVLKNKIVNDVERGNTAYGGYGSESNFLLYGDTKQVGPVLISRDIHKLIS